MYDEATVQLPEQASTLAPLVDKVYYEIYWVSVVSFILIVGAMCLFAWRYRRRKGVASKPPGHHNALELFWTFSPLIVLAYFFHQGFDGFMYMSVPPPNSVNIRVTAYKWRWVFEQPNGMQEGELTVPANRPVRLIMGSAPNPPGGRCNDHDQCEGGLCEAGVCQDAAVLHSFFVPAFRVKRDVVPGMFTSLWFEATREGDFQVYCTEYCGTGHSAMLSRAHVLSECEYDRYLAVGPQRPAEYTTDVEWGQSLFTNNGCPACHNIDAAQGAGVGPNLANVAGYPQPLEEGGSPVADTEYLRTSLREPQAQIVRGFTSAAMPSFAGLPQSQTNALIAYVASLSDRADTIQLEGAEAGGGEELEPCP
jgi:cytochrome c oxidase subunit 2